MSTPTPVFSIMGRFPWGLQLDTAGPALHASWRQKELGRRIEKGKAQSNTGVRKAHSFFRNLQQNFADCFIVKDCVLSHRGCNRGDTKTWLSTIYLVSVVENDWLGNEYLWPLNWLFCRASASQQECNLINEIRSSICHFKSRPGTT